VSRLNNKILLLIVILSISFIPLSAFNAYEVQGSIFVDDDADPSWYDATHVHNISEAIDNATAGDTVIIYNGNYTESPFTINKNLTFIGENEWQVRVFFNVVPSSPQIGAAMYITSDDVIIYNMTVYSAFLGRIIWATESHVSLQRMYIHDLRSMSSEQMVSFNPSGGIPYEDRIRVKNCTFYGKGVGPCIHLQRVDDYTIRDNTFYNNSGSYAETLSLIRTSNGTIYNNYFEEEGILISDADYLNISSNIIDYSSGYGIECDGHIHYLDIFNNRIYNCNYGIYSDWGEDTGITHGTVSHNVVRNCTNTGIELAQNPFPLNISHNYVYNSTEGIVVIPLYYYTTGTCNISFNNIFDIEDEAIDFQADNGTIYNNTIWNTEDGIYVNANNLTISKNYFYNLTDVALNVNNIDNCSIFKNTIVECRVGIDYVATNMICYNNTFRNNTIAIEGASVH